MSFGVLLGLGAVQSSAVPLPTGTPEQLHYLGNELSMFIHFSVCTFNRGCDGKSNNNSIAT